MASVKWSIVFSSILMVANCSDHNREKTFSDLWPPEIYRIQSETTSPGKDFVLFAAMPESPREILEKLDRVVLASYPAAGMDRDQLDDVNVASVAEMISILRKRGNDFSTEKPIAARFVGLCYHWAVLATSVLRSRGYACRVRCGFAPYLGSDQFGIDHTVIELWRPEQRRWQLIDPELIAIAPIASKNVLRISEPIDPYEVSRHQFHLAAEAWLNYRTGRVPDGYYGLGADESSAGFVRVSLIRDWLNILCAEQNVSFDADLKVSDGIEEDVFLDSVATLMLLPDSNFARLRELAATVLRN